MWAMHWLFLWTIDKLHSHKHTLFDLGQYLVVVVWLTVHLVRYVNYYHRSLLIVDTDADWQRDRIKQQHQRKKKVRVVYPVTHFQI